MDKQNMLYSYTGILASELVSSEWKYYNMGELWKHVKAKHKGQI